jgi:nucleotide-binding universal stress UspA family protein
LGSTGPIGLDAWAGTAELCADSYAAMLAEAGARLSDLHQVEVEVTTAILDGPEISALLGELSSSRMLVLGRRGIGRFAELVLGSTTSACAAHAVGPVVVVPPTWTDQTPAYAVVLLGLDGTRLGDAAIEFAFDEASRRGARLDIVHCWQLRIPSWYEDADVSIADDWRAEAERTVSEALAAWRDKYPDVEVRVTLELGHPVGTLVERSSTADLLVVGGHHHSEFLSRLSGSTELAVLHHAVCPVAVVHTEAPTAS